MIDEQKDENSGGEVGSNSNMNALMVAYYFPPMGLSGVQRTLKFVKYLPENGWNPYVLTTDSPAYYAFDDSLEQDLQNDSIRIYRTVPDKISKAVKPKEGKIVKYPSALNQRIRRVVSQTFLQPDSRITWKKHALALGRKILEENSIHSIFATAPPYTDFLVAHELAKESGLGYVLDYRDLWVDNAYYFYASPFHKSYAIDLETKMLTYAKRVVVINRYMKERMLQRYKFMSHEDITIIPHGYDEDDFSPFRALKPDPNFFTITHSGLFPDDLTPKYFFKALSLYIKKNPEAKTKIRANFVGLMRKSHMSMIKKYGLADNVVLKGYLPHSDCISEILQSDVLWMMSPNEIVTPSRLYEYIGALKPILISIPDGNMKQIALDTGAAVATDYNKVNQIVEAIDNLYKLWKTGYLPKANKSYAQSFERSRLTAQLARELAFTANY